MRETIYGSAQIPLLMTAMADGGSERKQILFNLLRSKDRTIVLLYLKTVSGEYKQIRHISDATGVDYSNVAGALIGNGKRFKTDRALVNTDLIICKEVSDGTVRYYKISDKGIEYGCLLEDRLHVQPVLDEVTGKFTLQTKDIVKNQTIYIFNV